MKRSYIYLIVVLLTISLVSADFIISKDLKRIIPLDDNYRTIEGDSVKEAAVYTALTIKNEQSSDEKITYEYSIKVEDVSGAIRSSINGQEKYVVFSANGEAKFQLKSNESIAFYEIPVGSNYKVTQLTTNNKYTVKVGSNTTKTYESVVNEDTSITFNNSLINKTTPKENKETKKEEQKIPKKEIPNTSETEIRMVIVLLISLLVIWCFRKIKVKRFE